MILSIVTESSGDPILRKRLNRVETFDANLQQIVDDMLETMHAPDPATGVKGVGLAANQVGIDAQVILITLNINAKKPQKPLAMINPEVLELSPKKVRMEEGCLSVPGIYDYVWRPATVKVQWQDVNGLQQERRFSGWDARVFLHEYDHLQGVLFTDYLK